MSSSKKPLNTTIFLCQPHSKLQNLFNMYTTTDSDPLSHVYAEVEASDKAGNGNHLLQRSISSNYLYNTGSYYCHSQHCNEFGECPVRRAYSAGDLEGVNNYMEQRRQRSDSSLSISEEKRLIIEGMMKAVKYSPEEKKERIERYRSKRRLRNFSKKIQYECRKTLADRRTRVKGRFVRIKETAAVTMMQGKSSYSNNMLNDDFEGEEESWINFLNYTNSS